MIDDPAELRARIAWVQEVRKVGQWPRSFGFVFCLIGVILLTYATYKVPGGPRSPFGYTSLAVIAVGWVLLFVSMAQRSRYVRAHPFEPKA
ncbi:MAG TPA: hypothetical protein VFN88_09210 [Caulobacteraceae bacterium]|nr:hypothetical protein [Caulobacteraceae bacterium]